MNLKNHSTPRPWMLSGPQGDVVTYAHGQTFRWFMNNIPPVTRRMANYVVGLLITVAGDIDFVTDEAVPPMVTATDIARALFESIEVQQTLFGTPISANHYRGELFSLFEFIGNGMQQACPEDPPFIRNTTGRRPWSHSYFIPLSNLCGMKGHHTTQLACCYDKASVVLRTAQAGVIENLLFYTGQVKISAIVVPEPEVRLGPGTQFIRYTQPAAAAGQIITIDSLGNATSLQGVEQGAGISALLWMTSNRGYGGAGLVSDIEYINVPFRDLQQTRHIEPLLLSWLNASGELNIPWAVDNAGALGQPGDVGPYQNRGVLYGADSPHGGSLGLLNADFLPIISPSRFLELSKVQVVQGSQTIAMKRTAGFSGEHVIVAAQYHSWTPALTEEVVRKMVDSGVAQAVWGTNDLVPKTKVVNKQPATGLNPAKTRFFATTWEPKTAVASPPTQ